MEQDTVQDTTKLPTLMRQFDTDVDLDNYVIEHAKYFTVIQIKPGGFVNGEGSNYTREECPTLESALERAAEIYKEKKKTLLIYAVADFAGAIGFNRPVRQYPASTWKSKADREREAKLERAQIRQRAKEERKPKEAAVFKTNFKAPSRDKSPSAANFLSSDIPMVRITSR